jgi:hypothetical protein
MVSVRRWFQTSSNHRRAKPTLPFATSHLARL